MSKANSADMVPAAWRQVHAFRLRRHHLTPRAQRGSLIDVVGDVCGIQAQVMAAAETGLWARVQSLTRQDVKTALEQKRSLAKIWCMRGTVHLLPAEEVAMYVAALGLSRLREHQRWLAQRGLSAQELAEISAAVFKTLEGGPLTRKELGDRVTALVGSTARPWIEHGWGAFVKHLSYEGRLCFGPNRGQEVTFARLDQWLPKYVSLPLEEARMSLVRRYLRGYGPATPQDFAAWSGLPMQEVNSAWQAVEEELATVSLEGKKTWLLRADLDDLQNRPLEAEPQVQLLPSFDVFLLSHREKSHLVDNAYYKRVYRKAGWLSPVVLVNGRVAGIWSHQRRGSKLNLTVELFQRGFHDLRSSIEENVADLGRFLNASIAVSYS